MRPAMSRRSFLTTCGSALAVTGLRGTSTATAATHSLHDPAAGVAAGYGAQDTRPAATPLKKAVKFGMVRENLSILEKFRLLKELGFDGVEMSSPNKLDADEVLDARDKSGLPIHGVVDSVHWNRPLSHPEPRVREQGLKGLRRALNDAKLYGASTVLLVPAVVKENVGYDEAYERSQAEIRKVIPLAEKLEIGIAFENVWNNFLLSPLEFARYIDEFESPWIGAYFDVGNIVKYGWPQQWIRILGKRIVKLDIKEWSKRQGFRAPLGEGDVNWRAVMKALRKIGYRGWGTAEIRGGDRKRLAEIARRMDRVFAG